MDSRRMLRAAFLGSTELFMKQMVEFLAQHGYWVLFASVLGRQACLPVPANLLLLAAGALAGLGKLNVTGIIVFAVAGFLLADTAWYGAGRTWGGRTLEFVCGAAADPCACVAKIASKFSRHGVRLLLVSKFIIGVDAVAAPMAGISRTGLRRFLVFDAMGAILWSSVYTALGYIFSDQLDHVAEYAAAMGRLAVLAGGAWLVALIILILYCASPGETTSARVALALRQRGFEHVRPLAGGLQSWREHGFPVTTDVRMLAAPEHAVFVLREVLQYSRMNAARLLETSVANVDQLLEGARKRIGRTASPQQVSPPN
jgi:membrane protein DedA with SNARE-associated domain